MEAYQDKFMVLALKDARQALADGEVPIGCVFVKDNQVIAHAGNRVNVTKNPTRHAELVCLDQLLATEVDIDYTKVTLYVNCEPCIMCASALQQIRIGSIFYGCSNPRFGGCGTVMDVFQIDSRRNWTPMVSKGHRSDEAVLLLKEFYQGENPNAPEDKRKPKR